MIFFFACFYRSEMLKSENRDTGKETEKWMDKAVLVRVNLNAVSLQKKDI